MVVPPPISATGLLPAICTDLIREGYVYLAKPPLYKIERNKKEWYAYSDDELNAILTEIGRDQNNKIQRYKGLGEMDAEQLWETTMDLKDVF